MPRIRIVLVEPLEGGNVGAVARAMKNFGFSDLVLTGDFPPLSKQTSWWASGAEDLVSSARRVKSLSEAIADAHLVVATMSARSRTPKNELRPRALRELVSTLGEDQTVALVFGRENSGLTTAEVSLCEWAAVIDTDRMFPTMNIAQAVCVFCYELSLLQVRRAEPVRELAPAGLIERLHEEGDRMLHEIGFLHADNPRRIYEDVQALIARAMIDRREATILMGIVRQVGWKIRTGGETKDSEP